MSVGPVVGVVGVTGAVGAAVARVLAAAGSGIVRLGARRPEAMRPLRTELGDRAEAVGVDVDDAGALERFCAGCQVVVNCAGPLAASRVGVAIAAWRAGADYVDPGGDDELWRLLAAARPPTGRVGVLSAGVMPGLTGLVPRWLATQGLVTQGLATQGLDLTVYISTLDRMTPASATEFLLGLGSTNGSWRAGVRVNGEAEALHRVELPFFAGPVSAFAHLSTEAERLARDLRLAEARWYHVFDPDGQVLPTLSRVQQQLREGAALGPLAAALSRAAEIEMLGRESVQQLVFQLTGREDGRPAQRVAVLRSSSTYELTATVTAMTVAALLRAALPAGVHFAAEVLDPGLVAGLEGQPGVVGWHVLDGLLLAYAEIDQGAL